MPKRVISAKEALCNFGTTLSLLRTQGQCPACGARWDGYECVHCNYIAR
jgi:hypothetical protein